ncbi:beta-alanine-activating enzyme isoform X1 [Sorex araneus]|uniref:beta-alanine-activating enzyme isoform X1 n=2 Tax=Sorex araneus TaxID=42254 RepID=UPI00243361D2|nr:beta-alanine-activating enzyme isoform X1 [Sorex araneus]XP_054996482.1 beta-alanine-activating enzyme isoform X1 [Sorex araneus]
MTLQELVHQAASLYSDEKAVCFDDCNNQPPIYYTYRTVVTLASELSHFLLSHCDFQGIREIGLYCHPGINLPSWILGILQVPAAYAPIDPDSPPTFSAHFMKKCHLKFILVEKQQISKFRSSYETLLTYDNTALEHNDLILLKLHWENTVVSLEINDGKGKYEKDKLDSSRAGNSHGEKSEEHMDATRKECLAYVLHTSGTTGTPKIVRVPHACIVPNIQHFREIFEVTQNDVLFLASPLTFDPSVVEIFVALSSGASLLIVPTSVKMLPSKLAAVLFSRHRVTVLQATPTLLRRFGAQLLKSTVLSTSTSLRVLALGGEAFPSLAGLRSWRGEGNRTQIFNVYGITEVSSWATFHKIPEEILNSTLKRETPVPLGFPLLGTVVEVRDSAGSTIQEGTGQVFLGGKNRVCFLDDEITVPFGTMRATGDFVTMEGGEMFFLGRKDSQIKRHGKRLNIEIVQQVAEGIEQVEACAVIWCNQEKLILFTVSKADLGKDYIFHELQERLPSHAVPDDLVPVDALPFTSHGKVDVSQLNKIYLNYINLKSESKLNGKKELWEKLQHLWKSILNLSEYPSKIPDESFTNCGGDSIKSIRLLNEIESLVGRSVPGLFEIILTSSISEIYNHVVQMVYPDKEVEFSKNCATKRKFSDVDQEESSRKSFPQIAARPSCPAGDGDQRRSFVALSRGSQIWSLSATGIFAIHSSDLISQMDSPNVPSSSSPALIATSPEPACVAKDSGEQMELRLRWGSDTGKCIDASPLVVVPAAAPSSATVYIGSHSHRMLAVDLYSGKVKWEQVLGDRIESSACVSKCGNLIAVGCYNGSVYVLKCSSGEKHWVFTTQDAVKSSAALDPTTGLLYIGSHDQRAYALDLYAKKCVWKSDCGGAIFSSPCVTLTPHHVYLATLGGLLVAVNPATGDRLWKHVCGKPLFSSPRACREFVCVGCVDGNLLCFTHSGEQVWQFSASEPIFSSPCPSASEQEIIFGSHDCSIYCCSVEGLLRWKFKTSARVYATPFVFPNHSQGSESLVAAASTDGKLWILDAQSGRLRGVHPLPGEVFSSPVVWESMLVIGCRDNVVYCLDLLCGNQK